MGAELLYVPGRLAEWASGVVHYPDPEDADPWLCDLEAYLWGTRDTESLEAVRLLCKAVGREREPHWGTWLAETVFVLLDAPVAQLELARGLRYMNTGVAAVVIDNLTFSMPKKDLGIAGEVFAAIEERERTTTEPDMRSYMRLLADHFQRMHLPSEVSPHNPEGQLWEPGPNP